MSTPPLQVCACCGGHEGPGRQAGWGEGPGAECEAGRQDAGPALVPPLGFETGVGGRLDGQGLGWMQVAGINAAATTLCQITVRPSTTPQARRGSGWRIGWT